MDNFKLFKDISDEEMLEMYKDILGSKEMGLRPRSLDSYAKQLKETCRFEMLSQAANFVIELFYEEVAMRYFKTVDDKKVSKKSESPFLLLTEDEEGNVSYCWWDNEEGLQEDAVERRGNGERIICAIEISSCRDVEIPPEYIVDDFIEEVNSAYDDAKEKGFDSIVLVVETDTEQTYYINDTEDGFQCDEFDYYFEDLDSIAETLFNEKIIGKPVEIRIE